MQRDTQYYYRWEICVRCDKHCRKRYFFGREGELTVILCKKCTRELKQKQYARIYPSRRNIERRYALRRAAAANR